MISLIVPFLMLIFVGNQGCSAVESAPDKTRHYPELPSHHSSTTSCYSSHYLDALLTPTEANEKPKLSDDQLAKFNALERFVHAFDYPEWYYQSCSMYPPGDFSIIYGQEKPISEGLKMSPRQKEALLQYRDSTLQLMEWCIEQEGRVQDEFLEVIIDFKAYELIPTLLFAYEEIPDPYILTSFCLLMKNDYAPFQQSDIYRAFYPEGKLVPSWDRQFIPHTKENAKAIISFAQAYYKAPKKSDSGFIFFPQGSYQIGKEGHPLNPAREIALAAFSISKFEITNAQFQEFISQTGYKTLAERRKDAFVFEPGLEEFEWIQDTTAYWRYPNGISRGWIEDKMDHPVTCISYLDAEAYCKWAGVRLPTLEEWEVASRGNSRTEHQYFDSSLSLIGQHANIWHGRDHLQPDSGDAYLMTSPVGSFSPNPAGLYDVYGNVFEFCANIPAALKDVEGIAVSRGGSWWCSPYACNFFNSVDIGRIQKAASFSNNGFRVVKMEG